MSKHYFYLSKRDSALEHALEERIAEEGGDASDTIKYLLSLGLGMSDARAPKERKVLPEYEQGNMERISISIPLEWLEELNLMAEERTTPKRKVSGAAVIREMIREALGKPKPEPVVRAPRDPQLSRDMIIEYQEDSFNSKLRNLRSKSEEPEVPLWQWVLENPGAVMHNPVFDCWVEGCKQHHETWHKHANRELTNWVERMRK